MFTIIYSRREYAKKYIGQTGHRNASQLDLENFYPAMMHQLKLQEQQKLLHAELAT